VEEITERLSKGYERFSRLSFRCSVQLRCRSVRRIPEISGVYILLVEGNSCT